MCQWYVIRIEVIVGIGSNCPCMQGVASNSDSKQQRFAQVSAEPTRLQPPPSSAAGGPSDAATQQPMPDDVWWTPDAKKRQLPITHRSAFSFPGLSAPLRGQDAYKHRKQWNKPRFVPEEFCKALMAIPPSDPIRHFFANTASIGF
jgi:hypothetical protein